eukprot:5867889-Amphidinium_carterae.1
MGADRLRMNQRSHRLEQLEASAVEVEVLIARERDSLHHELMTHLTSHGPGVTSPQPPPPPPPPPPPVVPQQSTSVPAVPQAAPTPQ